MDEEIQQTSLPAPLLGCLYCHSEGTIIQSEGRKFLGFGSDLPVLNCTQCGVTATFDPGENSEGWRIRYHHRRLNWDELYNFAARKLGKAGWLAAEKALDISRLVYIQRHRLQQTIKGDISWLRPVELIPPPPIIGAREIIYLRFRHVTYRVMRSTFQFAHNEGDPILNTGSFYVTDSHLHLAGKEDTSYKLSEIYAANFNHGAWFIYFQKDDKKIEYFRCDNRPEEMDAQLTIAVIEVLKKQ